MLKTTKTIITPMYSDFIDIKKPMFLQKESVLRFKKADDFVKKVRFGCDNDKKANVF